MPLVGMNLFLNAKKDTRDRSWAGSTPPVRLSGLPELFDFGNAELENVSRRAEDDTSDYLRQRACLIRANCSLAQVILKDPVPTLSQILMNNKEHKGGPNESALSCWPASSLHSQLCRVWTPI